MVVGSLSIDLALVVLIDVNAVRVVMSRIVEVR